MASKPSGAPPEPRLTAAELQTIHSALISAMIEARQKRRADLEKVMAALEKIATIEAHRDSW